MIALISELVLTPQRTPQKQLSITFKRKAEATVELHCAIAGISESFHRLRLGHPDCRFPHPDIIFIEQGRCVVKVRASRLTTERISAAGCFSA